MAFTEAASKIKNRLIMTIDALEKSGKNHLAFSAPDPIAIISLDVGLEGVLQKFKKKRIYVSEHRLPITTGMSDAKALEISLKVWKAIRQDYCDALDTKEIRTIICDTGTEMWENCRLSWFGKLTEVLPHHYAKPNKEWSDLVRMGYENDKNVIWLHKLKDEYTGNKRTGEYKRAGQSDMGFLVQVAGRAWKDPKVSTVPDKFHYTVTDCRFNPEIEGLDFGGEECNFPMIASYALYGDDSKMKEFT